MTSYTYQIEGGGVLIDVVVTEENGGLRFELAVDESTGFTGDLNALYLDIADETLLDGLTIEGSDVTGIRLDEDSVTKVDNFTNMNGEAIKEAGKFDIGVQFGTQGMSTDDIQSTSFFLSHDTETLSIDDFASLDNGVRLTSVGEVDGDREDSLKIVGTADVEEVPSEEPDAPVDEDPVVDIDPPVEEPTDPTDPDMPDGGVIEAPDFPPEEPEIVVIGEDIPADEPTYPEDPYGPTDEDFIEIGYEEPAGEDGYIFEFDEETFSEGDVTVLTAPEFGPEEDIFPPLAPEETDEQFLAEISVPMEDVVASEEMQEEPAADADWLIA
ncbi:hypothetical protein [Jannaschia donghaensis]|uniref:Uncharacterized protein n=1 Tax=Jannaschia donghaensis TaxID=420998 RepID=A0A0M6YJ55_9RHOB|nr:hypothetical protein [Jannaschia donghaensis]CTQ50391.1 hypothetical protein JDO7802_02414 [Jannaschia donghaensis]